MIVFWNIEIVSHSAKWVEGNTDEKEPRRDINGRSTFGKRKRQANPRGLWLGSGFGPEKGP